jgi:hypothetical protein
MDGENQSWFVSAWLLLRRMFKIREWAIYSLQEISSVYEMVCLGGVLKTRILFGILSCFWKSPYS